MLLANKLSVWWLLCACAVVFCVCVCVVYFAFKVCLSVRLVWKRGTAGEQVSVDVALV